MESIISLDTLKACVPHITSYGYQVTAIAMGIYLGLWLILKRQLPVPPGIEEERIKSQEKNSKKYEGDSKKLNLEKRRIETLSQKQYNDYIWRFSGVIHAACTCLPVYVYWQYNDYIHMAELDDISIETALLAISHAYWFIDCYFLLAGVIPWETIMIIHHIVTIGCIGPGYFYQIYMLESVALLGFAESAGIFHCLRFILDVNKYEGVWATINGVMFCLVFIYARTYKAYVMLADTLIGPHALIFKLQMVAIYYMTFIWVWQIMNLLPKKMSSAFPGNPVFSFWYYCMKKMRSLEILWWIGTFYFSIRLVLWDYLQKYGFINQAQLMIQFHKVYKNKHNQKFNYVLNLEIK